MNILIVDDSNVNLKIYSGLVAKHRFGEAYCFLSSRKALDWANQNNADLVIVDYNMPAPNGLEFIKLFRAVADKEQTPILMVTADHAKETRYAALDCGANDFLTKPIDTPEFCARVKNMLALSQSQQQLAETAIWLAEQVKAATTEIASRERETIIKLSAVAERRDAGTRFHLLRMAHFCQAIARGLGLSEVEQELILTASPLHDIGKVAIPDSILLKPDQLTPAEFAMMKQHTIVGFDMLKGSSSRPLQFAAEIALTHHEKYDGSGYPHGSRGNEIPLAGRICAISDVFDALTSTRPYKKAWPVEEAVAEINRNSGTHFAPELVRVFNAVLPDLLQIRTRHAENSLVSLKIDGSKRSNAARKRMRRRSA